MMQRKGSCQLFLISVALLFAIVFGDEESNDIQHHFHSSSVKQKDGSTSDATSSSSTGKLGSKGSPSSLPELLKSLNLQGFNLNQNQDPAASASSVTNSISSAANSNSAARNAPTSFSGYNYPEPPVPGTPGPPGGGFPYPYTIPWGLLGKGFGAETAVVTIAKKVILVIGGGILLLLILVVLKGSIEKGGFLNNFGINISKAFSGASAFDVGPIHGSAAGSAAAAVVNDPNFNRRVMDGVERRF